MIESWNMWLYLCVYKCRCNVILYLQHDFYNIILKIKHKLYIASVLAPPPRAKEKFRVRTYPVLSLKNPS
jgi:hypothetical protein